VEKTRNPVVEGEKISDKKLRREMGIKDTIKQARE
jgi:hypothetical protein